MKLSTAIVTGFITFSSSIVFYSCTSPASNKADKTPSYNWDYQITVEQFGKDLNFITANLNDGEWDKKTYCRKIGQLIRHGANGHSLLKITESYNSVYSECLSLGVDLHE